MAQNITKSWIFFSLSVLPVSVGQDEHQRVPDSSKLHRLSFTIYVNPSSRSHQLLFSYRQIWWFCVFPMQCNHSSCMKNFMKQVLLKWKSADRWLKFNNNQMFRPIPHLTAHPITATVLKAVIAKMKDKRLPFKHNPFLNVKPRRCAHTHVHAHTESSLTLHIMFGMYR